MERFDLYKYGTIDWEDRRANLIPLKFCKERLLPIEWLLKAKANVNDQDKQGNTALHYACDAEKDDYGSCRSHRWRNWSIDPEKTNLTNRKCTYIYDMVKMLLDNGADPNMTNDEGLTPINNLLNLDHTGNTTPALQLLLDADTNLKYDFMKTKPYRIMRIIIIYSFHNCM